jgi:hypothetical protein
MSVLEETKIHEKVIQFTAIRKVNGGEISDFVDLLSLNGNYILGMSSEQISGICHIRWVTESPNDVRALLQAHGISFYEHEVVVVQLLSLDCLGEILRCLRESGICVEYLYGLMINAEYKSGLVLGVNDIEMGMAVLQCNGYKVFNQSDLSR